MEASIKASELIETLLRLIAANRENNLMCINEYGDSRTMCDICRGGDMLCNRCPFNIYPEDAKVLQDAVSILKTMELIDE